MIRFRDVAPFTKYSSLGEPFTVYREVPLMPRIDDRFLDCSVYLYRTEPEARDGVGAGGSGFMAAIPGNGPDWLLPGECPQVEFRHFYAVTNRHIIEKTKAPVVRLNREETGTDGSRVSVIAYTEADWTLSDDHDVAVAPISYAKGNRYLFIDRTRFLTESKVVANDVGIGDETFMVGRFINHEGKQQNKPMVRWGHVSMMPVEVPDDPDDPQAMELCFAVEMHSLPGYSGSPVFVRPVPTPKVMTNVDTVSQAAKVVSRALDAPAYTSATVSVAPSVATPPPSPPDETVPGGPWLLGIQSRAIIDYLERRDVRHNTGMCGVVPAWHILDLLNTPKMRNQRKREQEAFRERCEQDGTVETADDQ